MLNGRRLTAGLLNMNIVLDRVPFTLSVSPSCRVLLFESVGAGLLSAKQLRFKLRRAARCVRIPPRLSAMVSVRLMSTVTSRGRSRETSLLFRLAVLSNPLPVVPCPLGIPTPVVPFPVVPIVC